MKASRTLERMLMPKSSRSIAVSFVNYSMSPNAFTSMCAGLAKDIEKTPYGRSYSLMNLGYKRLSEIAWHVSSKESAFYLIGQAYGTVNFFFKLLEAQRMDLQNYAYSCLYKQQYLKGLLLLLVAKISVRWGKKFLQEYKALNVEVW